MVHDHKSSLPPFGKAWMFGVGFWGPNISSVASRKLGALVSSRLKNVNGIDLWIVTKVGHRK